LQHLLSKLNLKKPSFQTIPSSYPHHLENCQVDRTVKPVTGIVFAASAAAPQFLQQGRSVLKKQSRPGAAAARAALLDFTTRLGKLEAQRSRKKHHFLERFGKRACPGGGT